MHPASTSYFLCTNSNEYKRCHTLQRRAGQSWLLHFPTVFAQRGGQVIGFLSSRTNGALRAGPLVLSPDLRKPIFTAVRLVEAYDNVLRTAGVKSYLFGVDKTNTSWLNAIAGMGLTPYAETDTEYWFVRNIL